MTSSTRFRGFGKLFKVLASSWFLDFGLNNFYYTDTRLGYLPVNFTWFSRDGTFEGAAEAARVIKATISF